MTTIYIYECEICQTRYDNKNDVSEVDINLPIYDNGKKHYFCCEHICDRCVEKLQDILIKFFDGNEV